MTIADQTTPTSRQAEDPAPAGQAGARVVADSVTAEGHRLTTFEATCWRPMLAEQNTHGALSRNSASSRARPFPKVLADFDQNRARPIVWPHEQSGMQGGTDLEGTSLTDARVLWHRIERFVSSEMHRYLDSHPDPDTRLHKSLLNRWLEPGLWQTQVISATNLDGYFWQRRHDDADPHIRVMADAMWEAREASEPSLVEPGGWHLPYWAENGGHEFDWADAEGLVMDGDSSLSLLEIAKACSAARCARVSYLTQSNVRDLRLDLTLYDRLISNRVGDDDPPHASPLEHPATPWPENSEMVTLPNGKVMGPLPRVGKFLGWCQLRHLELGF